MVKNPQKILHVRLIAVFIRNVISEATGFSDRQLVLYLGHIFITADTNRPFNAHFTCLHHSLYSLINEIGDRKKKVFLFCSDMIKIVVTAE